MESNELYHYGVLGMKWGKHAGLKATQAKYIRKANKYGKQLARRNVYLETTSFKNEYNPIYRIRKHRQEKAQEKYNDAVGIAKACQKLIDTNDPIGRAMDKCDKAVDKGLDWVTNNPDVAKKYVNSIKIK